MYLETAASRLSGPNGYGYGPGCDGNDGNFIEVRERAYRNTRKFCKEEQSGNMPLTSLATVSHVGIPVGNSFDALFDAEDSYNDVQQQAIAAGFKGTSMKLKKKKKGWNATKAQRLPSTVKVSKEELE